MAEGKYKIIYTTDCFGVENNKPYGIRDSGGYVLFFPTITKWSEQDDRYRIELDQQKKLAESLLSFMNNNATEEVLIETKF